MKNYFVQIQEILKILLIICVFHVCRPGLCIPGLACAHNGKLEKKKKNKSNPGLSASGVGVLTTC